MADMHEQEELDAIEGRLAAIERGIDDVHLLTHRTGIARVLAEQTPELAAHHLATVEACAEKWPGALRGLLAVVKDTETWLNRELRDLSLDTATNGR